MKVYITWGIFFVESELIHKVRERRSLLEIGNVESISR